VTKPANRTTRPTSPVNARLDRQLIAYAAAAGAAGVGMLAAPQFAEARVIYTATNVSIGGRATVPIDVNNDGIADFELITRFCGSHSDCLVVNPLVTGNGIRGTGSNVAAGFLGVPVGPGGKFLTGVDTGDYGNLLALAGAYGPYSWSAGNWAHTTSRYMGLKFLINGQIHYGWARLSVNLLHGPTVLTGYAYETIPNQKIFEGHTQGSSAANLLPADPPAPSSQPAGLGMLARGADGLALWRRDDEAAR
jgi:hypothetical protein